jgi:hypothetical protein
LLSERRLAIDRPLQLRFAHLGPTCDPFAFGLFLELISRPATRTPMETQAASTARGDVVGRAAALGFRFTVTRSLLLHRPRRDLFRQLLSVPPLFQAVPM